MKVLLIGDSIRLFYEEALRKELGDAYQVYSPSENCRFAAYAANSLRFWLNDFPKPISSISTPVCGTPASYSAKTRASRRLTIMCST